MAKRIKCPTCKTVQPLGPVCQNPGCRLDFKDYVRRKRQARAASAEAPAPIPVPAPAPEAGPRELLDLEEHFGRAWKVYKKRVLPLLGLYLLATVFLFVPIIVSVVLSVIFAAIYEQAAGLIIVAGVVGGTVFGLLMSLYFYGGFVAAGVDSKLSVGPALKRSGARFGAFMWVMILIHYIIGGGFLLFFVPGLFFIVWTFAAEFMVFAEGASGMDAVLKSREYVRGHGWDVALRCFLIMIFYWFASFVPVVGVLLFMPYLTIFSYIMYEDLRSIKGVDIKYTRTVGAKLKWLCVATLGYLIPLALVMALASPMIKKGINELKDLGSRAKGIKIEAPLDRTFPATIETPAPAKPALKTSVPTTPAHRG